MIYHKIVATGFWVGLLSLYTVRGQLLPGDSLAALSGAEQYIAELDFRDRDLRDVVRSIARMYKLNLFIDNAIDQKISLHLSRISVADALNFIAAEYGLAVQRTGKIIKITRPQPPPAPKIRNIAYSDGLLSLELNEEELHEAVKYIADSTGITLLAERSAKGNLTARIARMPLEEALAWVFRSNGFLLGRSAEAWLVRRNGIFTTAEREQQSWVQVQNGKVAIEASSAPLNSLLLELSLQSGISFSLLGEPQGEVTVSLRDMSLDECLDILLVESEFTFRRKGGLYLIGKRDAASMITSELMELNHLKVEGVIERLPAELLQRAGLKTIPEHNALMVSGSQDVVNAIATVLRQIDKPIPQVFFEALAVDYNMSDSYEFAVQAGLNQTDSTRAAGDSWIPGVDFLWNAANANTYLGRLDDALSAINIGTLPDNFFLRVRALESAGKANIRSVPQISSLNGHTAEIKVGETRYYRLTSETPLRDPAQVYLQTTERFQTIEINISLRVTPWVSASGEITVEIFPEFNTPGEQISPDLPPTIQSRSLSSTVRLRDGETIVLGGLIQDIETSSSSGIPLLRRIPLLGKLFSKSSRSRAKSELIIYITPHLQYGRDWQAGKESLR